LHGATVPRSSRRPIVEIEANLTIDPVNVNANPTPAPGH
jgi:hypothetical protein